MNSQKEAGIELGAENTALTDNDRKMSSKDLPMSRKEVALKLISEMSISGLNRAAATSSTRIRAFWSTLFIIGFVGFTYNLVAITNQFVEAPKLTQMNYEYANFTWPHITFCSPTNPIAFWKQASMKEKWNALIEKSKGYPTPIYNNVEIRDQYYAMSSLSAFDFYKVPISSVIHSLRLISLRDNIAMSSEELDKLVKIPKEFYRKLFIRRRGSSRFPIMCFSLHLEHLSRLKGITDPGDVDGIKIMLIMDQGSYQFFNFGYEKRKMKLFFNLPNTTLHSAATYSIYPGSESEFTITEAYNHRIGNCDDHIFSVEEFNVFLNASYPYVANYEDCRQYLSQKLYFINCHCYNPFLPLYKLSDATPRLCLNMTIFSPKAIETNINCMIRVSKENDNSKSFQLELDKKCSKYLIPQCKKTTYEYVQNTVGWETDMNKARLTLSSQAVLNLPNANPNATVEFLSQNLASIKLTRKSKKIVGRFEEFEYPLSQFMSDVGGILGLWLGFSIIGFFELVELVLVVYSTKSK